MYILNESCNTCTLTLDHTRRFTTSLSSPTFVFPHNCFRGRNGWDLSLGHLPSPHVCFTFHICVSFHTEETHLYHVFGAQSPHARLNLGLSRSCGRRWAWARSGCDRSVSRSVTPCCPQPHQCHTTGCSATSHHMEHGGTQLHIV